MSTESGESELWERGLEESRAEERKGNAVRRGRLVPLSQAQNEFTVPKALEDENNVLVKYKRLFEIFSALPPELHDEIIKDLTLKKTEGVNPKDLIARAIDLVHAYQKFTELDAKPTKKGEGDEAGSKEFEEVVEELHRIRSELPNEDSPKSGLKDKVEDREHPPKWVQ
ncbi:MAG: hypothetical protein ABSE18_01910 [Minisyncoccia bacterium]|jgi:hypothetical protein